MEKQNKLSNIIDYYEKRLEDSTDNRPTTGMIGQHCLGFVQDSNGKLIRIIPEIKGEEDVSMFDVKNTREKPTFSIENAEIDPEIQKQFERFTWVGYSQQT